MRSAELLAWTSMGCRPVRSMRSDLHYPPRPSPAFSRRYPAFRRSDAGSARSAVLDGKCGCPRHLAELIPGLSAFERCSTECETRRTPETAEYATVSRARHMIEDVLDRVIERQNIRR